MTPKERSPDRGGYNGATEKCRRCHTGGTKTECWFFNWRETPVIDTIIAAAITFALRHRSVDAVPIEIEYLSYSCARPT